MFFAKLLRTVPSAAFSGLVAPIVSRHERHQAGKEGPFAVDVVKALRLLFGKPRHSHATNAKSGLLDHCENLAKVARRYRVRLDDCKCLFDCHVQYRSARGGS